MKFRSPQALSIAVLLSFVGLVTWSSAVHSPAIDEVAHLPSGISHLQFGRFELYAVNPPLAESWAALPVICMAPVTDWTGYYTRIASRSEFIVGKRFIAANGPRSSLLFLIGRLALLPFSILGILIMSRWYRLLLGNHGTLPVTILFAFSPLVLGNASLVTPDVAATAGGLTAIYYFRAWLNDTAWSNTFQLGIVTGVGLLTKFTWCIVFPLIAPVGITHYWWIHRGSLRAALIRLSFVAVLALFVVNALYGFDSSFQSVGSFEFVSEALTGGDDASITNRFRGSVLETVPMPIPGCYLLGIDAQKRDFEQGYPSYLLGEWKHGGWWYYYLIGFLVKEPIGFQLMLYASIVSGLWSWRKWTRESVREWSLIVVPPLLIFGLVSSQTGFNHHMRYVLPAYPFLFIIAARTVTLGKFWKWFSYGCLTWQAAAVLWFAPHWMSYFNEAAGGPLNGHKYLVDSNIDWGQDILMLKWWQDKHPEATDLQAALFTGFDPKDIGLKFRLPAPYMPLEPQTLSKQGLRGPQPGWYAISVCQLKGHSFSVPEGDGTWSWSDGHFTYFMDNFEPVDRIGYSIYIYHITEDQAAEVRAHLRKQEWDGLAK